MNFDVNQNNKYGSNNAVNAVQSKVTIARTQGFVGGILTSIIATIIYNLIF